MINLNLGRVAIIAICISATLIAGCQSNINSMLSFMQTDERNIEVQADERNIYEYENEGKTVSPLRRYLSEFDQNKALVQAVDLLDTSYEEKGVEQLEELAEQGNSKAMFTLYLYYYQKGNLKLSEEWRKKALALRDYMALLGNVEIVENTGSEWLKTQSTLDLALAGNLASQAKLGSLYFTGKGMPIDHDKGLYWLHKVADLNMDLYLCEESEVSRVKNSIMKASEFLTDIYSGNLLKGKYKNIEKYKTYLGRSAEYGSFPNQINAAILYSYIDGYKNSDLANKFFNYALDPKNEAQESYGKAAFIYADFLSRTYGKQRNQDVVKYLNIAKRKGFLDKYLDIGDFYYLINDFVKAKVNYEKAFKKDKKSKAKASYYLGVIYLEGQDVPNDYKKALYYLNQAFLLNQKEAAFPLSKIYALGLGVKIDVDKALVYLNIACMNGDDSGCKALDNINNYYYE